MPDCYKPVRTPKHLRDMLEDDEVPRIQLCRITPGHVRMIEVLRFITSKRDRCRVDTNEIYDALIYRGILSPDTSFINEQGGKMPTLTCRGIVIRIIAALRDMHLIKRSYPKVKSTHRRARIYEITPDGRQTLLFWDDPYAPGVFPT